MENKIILLLHFPEHPYNLLYVIFLIIFLLKLTLITMNPNPVNHQFVKVKLSEILVLSKKGQLIK